MEIYAEISSKQLEQYDMGRWGLKLPSEVKFTRCGSQGFIIDVDNENDFDDVIEFLDSENICWQSGK